MNIIAALFMTRSLVVITCLMCALHCEAATVGMHSHFINYSIRVIYLIVLMLQQSPLLSKQLICFEICSMHYIALYYKAATEIANFIMRLTYTPLYL